MYFFLEGYIQTADYRQAAAKREDGRWLVRNSEVFEEVFGDISLVSSIRKAVQGYNRDQTVH